MLSFLSFSQNDDGRKITIPIIFHVIYVDDNTDNGMGNDVKKGKTGNSTTNLPKEKIQAELNDLDANFQQLNSDASKVLPEYKPVVGNAKIHFTLRNIIYIKVDPASIYLRNNSDRLHEISPLQAQDSCLNVYISVLRVSGSGSEGVTNVPIDVLPSSDAVNLNYSWVGLGYHLLSHEVGHWLGLWHVFDKNQINISQITDIPVQTDLTEIDCVICTRPGVKVIRSQRNQFTSPNTNNFMDYSGCRSMFSIQQCNYMRSLIIKLRPAIWNNLTSKK
jgi:hypothetical protein